VAGRVLRLENYFVAMVSQGLLEVEVRLGAVCCRRRRRAQHAPLGAAEEEEAAAARGGSELAGAAAGDSGLRLPITHTLEWAVRAALLAHIVSSRLTLRRSLVGPGGAARLRRRFRLLGLLLLLASPFVCLFLLVFFAVRQAEDVQAKRDWLGPRTWSPAARWLFRCYNELPHAFARRLRGADASARRYLRHFTSPLQAILSRAAALIFGAVLTLLAALTLFDESILLYIHLGGRNLLWYSALLAAAVALARALGGSDDATDAGSSADAAAGGLGGRRNAEAAMADLASHTLYYPRRWRRQPGAARSTAVFREVSALFPFRLQLFLQELAGAALTPLILLFILPAVRHGCAWAGETRRGHRIPVAQLPGSGAALAH
jgi:autophagy-related protein 9